MCSRGADDGHPSLNDGSAAPRNLGLSSAVRVGCCLIAGWNYIMYHYQRQAARSH